MGVRALWYENGQLVLLDQRRLPHTETYMRLDTCREVAQAIKDMAVRGAPAIGVAAAYGFALGMAEGLTPEECRDVLASTRPTARDLFSALEFMYRNSSRADEAARQYHEMVVGACRRIGELGAEYMPDDGCVLTHCNAGALATVEYGTALAPIRHAVASGKRLRVLVDETRPWLQGARLTAWELAREGIEHHLIVDNAAGHYMRLGEVDAVIVGADRIALNGDFANKIGTYEKAVVAHENGIPFYVAAPTTTVDAGLETGDSIPIEERPGSEVAVLWGRRICPEDTPVRNPSFDVTPAKYVTAFITEKGVVTPREIEGVVHGR